MSTVQAVNFKHPSSTTNNLVLSSTGGVSGAFPAPNRNLLYNGAMQCHQRGTSVAGTTAGGYLTADRWKLQIGSLGTWTNSIESDGPTGSGLTKSFKMLCTTADAAPAAGDYCQFVQILEGQDLQRIAKGTASAQQLTLSFWVKSNKTGTYAVNLYDNDNSRQAALNYTINASATWEKKTLTFAADTTGAFDNDNAASLVAFFWLAAGSTYTSGSATGSWSAYSAANEAPSQTNLAAATNNFWQITGVQLETGNVPTDFEFKSYGQELRECQRYFQKIINPRARGVFNTTTAVARAAFMLNQQMRIAPVVTYSGTTHVYDGSTTGTITSISTFYTEIDSVEFDANVATGTFTVGRPVICYDNDGNGTFLLNSEL